MKQLEITDHPAKKEIERRIKIMAFFDAYGAAATKEAFNVSRSTVFGWKKILRDSGGKLVSLASGSKTPKNKRVRETHVAIIQFIGNYRLAHPGVGKETIKPELDEYCREVGLACTSESTVGRVIADLKKQGKLPKSNKLRLNGRSGELEEKQEKSRPRKTDEAVTNQRYREILSK
jgi:transposase